LRLSDVPCNLAWGKRVNTGLPISTTEGGEYSQTLMVLLVPALTDIRDAAGLVGVHPDLVVVPSGSGRWYSVMYVDDLGKGFPNEHRGAVLYKAYEKVSPTQYPGLAWPVPIP
jgi:hypothetical protein